METNETWGGGGFLQWGQVVDPLFQYVNLFSPAENIILRQSACKVKSVVNVNWFSFFKGKEVFRVISI